MDDPRQQANAIRATWLKAMPLTRRVMMLAWLLIVCSFLITGAAIWLQVNHRPGIITHPPGSYFVASHLIAVVGSVCGIYTLIYLPVRKNIAGVIVAGVTAYGCFFAATAWGIPVLTSSIRAQAVTQERQIYDVHKLRISRLFSCKSKIQFGPFYAPKGHICSSTGVSNSWIDETLLIHGVGNSWATRVTGYSFVTTSGE